MICALPQLNFLDEAAVTDKDRRLAAAFVQVGRQGHLALWWAAGHQDVSAASTRLCVMLFCSFFTCYCITQASKACEDNLALLQQHVLMCSHIC
jgi:hypothetical protein